MCFLGFPERRNIFKWRRRWGSQMSSQRQEMSEMLNETLSAAFVSHGASRWDRLWAIVDECRDWIAVVPCCYETHVLQRPMLRLLLRVSYCSLKMSERWPDCFTTRPSVPISRPFLIKFVWVGVCTGPRPFGFFIWCAQAQRPVFSLFGSIGLVVQDVQSLDNRQRRKNAPFSARSMGSDFYESNCSSVQCPVPVMCILYGIGITDS